MKTGCVCQTLDFQTIHQFTKVHFCVDSLVSLNLDSWKLFYIDENAPHNYEKLILQSRKRSPKNIELEF